MKTLIKTTKSILGVLTITLALAVEAQAQSFLTNGLVAYYPFNGNANDASGNGYNGTTYNTTIVADYMGNPGSAYHLNGTNAYIYFGPILPDMQAMTVSAWVNSSGGGTFFADADGAAGNDLTIQLSSASTSVRCDKPPAPGGTSYTFPLGVTIGGSWNNLTWTLTTNAIRVYVNGILKRSSGNLGGVDVAYHDFIIGTMEFPYGSIGWGGYWKGDVCKLKIYNRALSALEIQQSYAYDTLPRLGLLTLNEIDGSAPAVIPLLYNLALGSNYQLQVSSDLNTWTNTGSAVTATTNNMMYPGYWGADDGQAFFRLLVSP